MTQVTLTVTTYVEVDEKYYCRKHGKEANEKALVDKQSEFEGLFIFFYRNVGNYD